MYVDYKEVGKRIAARRRELGLKQSEVNEAAGLSDKYLSNIERATSVLSVDVLMRLCAALDTTPDRILLGAAPGSYGSDIKKAVSARSETLSPKQAELVLNFIEWVSGQDI